jgi:hypothetical protein
VTVTRPFPVRHDRGVAGEVSLDQAELARHAELVVDDPLRTVHVLPRVAAVDDYSTEFAVRGSPFGHTDVVIDGVSAQGLRHSFPGRGVTASLAMLTGGVVEKATLRAGSYPRRHGDRLGPQLELTTREGSRDRLGLRGMVGGSFTGVVGEGPLGRAGRGSWLFAARQSYLEWPAERAGSSRAPFAFGDWVGKAVYDIGEGQQIETSVLSGTSSIDADDLTGRFTPGDGTNRATMASLIWRSRAGRFELRQQAYVVSRRVTNTPLGGRATATESDANMAYRADLIRSLPRGIVEIGGRMDRLTSLRGSTPADAPAGAGRESQAALRHAWGEAAAYAHVAWSVTPSLTVSPGVRAGTSTFSPYRPVSRWILAEWALNEAWTLSASAGRSHQWPDWWERNLARTGAPRPAQATHIDVSIERELGGSLRWQVSLFSRRERDVRDPGRALRPDYDQPDPSLPVALRGTSHGLEVVVDRRSGDLLSGWVGYSYGRSRYSPNTGRHETFWADFDRRHAVTVAGRYRLSPSTGIAATFRAGTGFPLPGYFESRDSGLFVGPERNRVRLPVHARLDVRADRSFDWLGRRVTLVGEVLNVLDRQNIGLGNGTIGPAGEARGWTEVLLGRRPSIGLVIDF